MTTDEFVSATTGVMPVFPNCQNGQCMTLMHIYLRDVLGITDPLTLATPSAYQLFTHFSSLVGHDLFTLIPNTPDGIPEKGDIMVFGQGVGVDGHVAIYLDGDVYKFRSFDSNWPLGTAPHVQEHDYGAVLGWLRFSPPPAEVVPAASTPTAEEVAAPEEKPAEATPEGTYYQGIDITNEASVKAAVDTWKRVVDGEFVAKDAYNELQAEFETYKQSQPNVSDIFTQLSNALSIPVTSDLPTVLEHINVLKQDLAAQVSQMTGVPLASQVEGHGPVVRPVVPQEKKESILQKLEAFAKELEALLSPSQA